MIAPGIDGDARGARDTAQYAVGGETIGNIRAVWGVRIRSVLGPSPFTVRTFRREQWFDNVATRGYIEDTMKTVGVRELKNRLSEYIRQVRSGESVLVTDRGEVVAELTPPGHGTADGDMPAALRALAKRGLVTLGAPGDASLYPALPRKRKRRLTAAQLLEEERGSR
jgi:prevent-host-death family protein